MDNAFGWNTILLLDICKGWPLRALIRKPTSKYMDSGQKALAYIFNHKTHFFAAPLAIELSMFASYDGLFV